jgi:hypothetical protein
MQNKTFYFEWEGGPAIIRPSDPGFVEGLYLSSKTNKWIPANVLQYGDFYDNGDLMSKGEFDKKFGGIGKKLPKIPG